MGQGVASGPTEANAEAMEHTDAISERPNTINCHVSCVWTERASVSQPTCRQLHWRFSRTALCSTSCKVPSRLLALISSSESHRKGDPCSE